MKTIITILFLVALSACGQSPVEIKSVPITMTISKIVDDKSSWGCVGTDSKTILRSDDGRVESFCGVWGNVGDKISGCWETGHNNETYSLNGFHRICNK